MSKEQASLEVRLKKKYREPWNYRLEKIKYFMSQKHKKIHRALNYVEYFCVFVSAVSGCV